MSYLVYLCQHVRLGRKQTCLLLAPTFQYGKGKLEKWNGGGCSLHTEESGEAEAPIQTSHLSVLSGAGTLQTCKRLLEAARRRARAAEDPLPRPLADCGAAF